MHEVDLAGFAAAHANGAVVIDVRQPDEYASGHVPGARSVPLDQLPQRVGEMPRDQRVYLICRPGKRSLAAVDLLTRAGIDAVSVSGGTDGWQRAGKPVTSGTRP
jgi:rhodanese-related sulfurtransferase